jgi:hypothetical protein
MYVSSSSDTERTLAVELVLEDIPGGGVVEKDDFKTASTEMKEGALLGVDANGIYHLTKTAKVYEDTASGGTTIKVYQDHEFKAADVLGNTAKTMTTRDISSIAASGTDYDTITLDDTNTLALIAGDILIEVETPDLTTTASFKYSPVAVATNPVDLSADNTGCGLLVRGRVRESLLPYYVDSTLKALLPLVRFV